jgi:ABC-type antimicrobial peptide transport system permease subunit
VLTTLGIVMGIAAVIAMMEIGQGSATAIQRTISSMGANRLLVLPGSVNTGGVHQGSGSVVTLTPSDCNAIMTDCPSVICVAPFVHARTQVVNGNRNWVPGYIGGTTPQYLQTRNWTEMAEGGMFSDRDVAKAAAVCVLGKTVVKNLFGDESPVGKDIRIQGVAFRVLGVLSPKGANMFGQDQDDLVLAPWTTIKYRVSSIGAQVANQSAIASSAASGSNADASTTISNTASEAYPNVGPNPNLYPSVAVNEAADTPQPVRFQNVDSIVVQAESAAAIPEAIDQITALLHDRHHISADESDDFNVRDLTEMTSAMARQSRLMGALLLSVAMISLMVGGVGIMNIMLVSVTERTREIGLRMAVGARPRDILRQFIAEAVILCLFGGMVGILVGRGASIVVRDVLNWPTEISLPAIVAAVVVSVTVGLVFGYYPAWKASRLDPIDALRYE